MGPEQIFNQEISDDQDLAKDDQRSQKKLTSFTCIAGTHWVRQSDVLASIWEPMVRKVVAEELDLKLGQNFSTAIFPRPPQIQALQTSRYKLVFSETLSLPIFAGKKILDRNNNPLEIRLVDPTGDQMTPVALNPPPKVELVVLNGDFPLRGYDDSWTSQQFDNNVVKEREGKPPLLRGDLLVTLKHGVATVGDIEFTDNSSWTRSRKFKIGVRVAARGGTNSFQGCVVEAKTEPFVVREYRMGLYKKHYPPMLDDEVWRLVKIRKNGVFHKKLDSQGISTVRDFLSATATDQKWLRGILGSRMSDKTWKALLKHAKTCKVDTNISHEQSSTDSRVQLGISVTENALPAEGAMMDQPCLSHVQVNEYLNDANVDGEIYEQWHVP